MRDPLVDWILVEAETEPGPEFEEALLQILERLLDLKSRPRELTSWSPSWLEGHSVFVYETFLYMVAALLRSGAFSTLHEIFSSHYLLPETVACGAQRFDNFQAFHGHSDALQVLAPEGRRLISPAAELVKRQADRQDLPFDAVMEAEALVLMMAFLASDSRWYPQTLLYAQRQGPFPFFLRASQHRHFLKLATITGITDADALRAAVKEGQERLGVSQWHDFSWLPVHFGIP